MNRKEIYIIMAVLVVPLYIELTIISEILSAQDEISYFGTYVKDEVDQAEYDRLDTEFNSHFKTVLIFCGIELVCILELDYRTRIPSALYTGER